MNSTATASPASDLEQIAARAWVTIQAQQEERRKQRMSRPVRDQLTRGTEESLLSLPVTAAQPVIFADITGEGGQYSSYLLSVDDAIELLFNHGVTADALDEVWDEERQPVVLCSDDRHDLVWLTRPAQRPAAANEGGVSGSFPCFALTDLGNAERIVHHHGEDLRFVPARGWHAWTGDRWERDSTGEAMRRAKIMARSINNEAINAIDREEAKKIAKWAYNSEGHARLVAALKSAETEQRLVVRPEELDSDPMLFNVANGTIDLRTGRISRHWRDNLITRISKSVTYSPRADAPTFRRFLEEILPDAEVRAFVQRYVGYCLTASVEEQVLVFWYGEGANGKSTLLEVLQEAMGMYAMTGAASLLLAKDNETHPTEQADLLGARLVVLSEIEKGKAWAEATIKRLTGGDTIKARHMRQDFFEFKPTHKFIVMANHKPIVRGTDHAIWRRIRLVPFDQKFEGSSVDTLLKDKLLRELPGIMRWCVEGCLAWQSEGLGAPKAVTEATDTYRAEQDVIGRFIEERCFCPKHAQDRERFSVNATKLYKAYTEWCEAQGEVPEKQKAFGQSLKEREAKLGLSKGKDREGIVYKGISLHAPTERASVVKMPAAA